MSNQQQEQQQPFTTYFYCPLQVQVQEQQVQVPQQQMQQPLPRQKEHVKEKVEYYPANLYASNQCPQYAQYAQLQQQMTDRHYDSGAQSALSSSLSNFNSNANRAQLLHFGNQVYELKEESLESLLEEGLCREKQSGNFPLQQQSLLLGQIPSTTATATTTTVTVPTASVHHAPIQPNSFIQVSADTQFIPSAPPVTASSSSSSTSTTSTTSTITSSTTQAVVEKKGKGHPRKRKQTKKKKKKKGSTSSLSPSSQSTDGESTSDESTHLQQQQQQQEQQQQKELIYRGALHRRNSKPLPGDKFISTWILK